MYSTHNLYFGIMFSSQFTHMILDYYSGTGTIIWLPRQSYDCASSREAALKDFNIFVCESSMTWHCSHKQNKAQQIE